MSSRLPLPPLQGPGRIDGKRIAALGVCAVALSLTAGYAHADPRAQVRGDVSGELREQLVRAIGEADDPPTNRFDARRRARGAMEAAEALLRSEGYYQPTLEDIVEGEQTSIAIVNVTPGRRFVLGEPAVNWIAPAPAPDVAQAVIGGIGLKPGDPGRAVEVIAAEGRLIAGLTRRGYADAVTQPRRVVVDHADFTVQPTYNIASGRLVLLDGVQVQTSGRTNVDWVAGLAPWSEGDRYDPELVAELERRLLDTGVYDGVGVALAATDQTTPEGHRPVVVTLTDRPRRILEAGATFSTAEGSGVDLIWTHYNRLRRADTIRYEARLADIDSRLGVDVGLPHWRRPAQTLKLSTAVVHENTDAYDRTALTMAADLQQRIGRTSYYSYGLGLDAGNYREDRFAPDLSTPDPDDGAIIGLDRNLVILTGRGSAYLDRSNDPLNPTNGYRLTLNVQPTAVSGEDSVLFLRTEAQGTGYLPLQNGKTILAGRLRIGSIIGGEELTVPSDRLFYSGGGGSVRGYEYQGVNPELSNDTPRGGLSLFEVSAEVRRDLGKNFGAVAFIDGGAIGFQETPDLSSMRYAVGIGARYNLSFGPVRADIAFPLNKRDGDANFQIYISIGQAF